MKATHTAASIAMKSRLLVVPHVFAEDICVREIELARNLTHAFEVYCLSWRDALNMEGGPSLARRWRQFRRAVDSACAPRKSRPGRDGVTLIEAPVLQSVLLHRIAGRERAEAWARAFNRRTLEAVAEVWNITHLLLAATSFEFPRVRGLKKYLDVVDWFPEDLMTEEKSAAMRRVFMQNAAAADGVFAVSEPLCEKLKDDCGIQATPLPNGADLEALRAVPAQRVAVLRRRLGLENKYVIGYIGNHGSYTGVDFAVKVFERARTEIPNAALLIVGPAEYWRGLLESKRDAGVVWTGPVPPTEVAAYFHALDLGILAQEKSLGTELAFQIKIVEYTACRKLVVSTPLATWERLAWPNVSLARLEVDAWVSAIVCAHHSRWRLEWDGLVEPYDWRALAARLAGAMLGKDRLTEREAELVLQTSVAAHSAGV